jgi:hypothetical protein
MKTYTYIELCKKLKELGRQHVMINDMSNEISTTVVGPADEALDEFQMYVRQSKNEIGKSEYTLQLKDMHYCTAHMAEEDFERFKNEWCHRQCCHNTVEPCKFMNLSISFSGIHTFVGCDEYEPRSD